LLGQKFILQGRFGKGQTGLVASAFLCLKLCHTQMRKEVSWSQREGKQQKAGVGEDKSKLVQGKKKE